MGTKSDRDKDLGGIPVYIVMGSNHQDDAYDLLTVDVDQVCLMAGDRAGFDIYLSTTKGTWYCITQGGTVFEKMPGGP